MKTVYKVAFCLLGLFMVIVITSGTVSAAPNMQEGNWEISMEMKMEGLPFPMPPFKFTNTQCLTKEDIVPNTAKKNENCTTKNQKITGNKVTWKVVCEDSRSITEGDGEITYSGSSYKGKMNTKITDRQSGQVTNATTKMNGRRTGDCRK